MNNETDYEKSYYKTLYEEVCNDIKLQDIEIAKLRKQNRKLKEAIKTLSEVIDACIKD